MQSNVIKDIWHNCVSSCQLGKGTSILKVVGMFSVLCDNCNFLQESGEFHRQPSQNQKQNLYYHANDFRKSYHSPAKIRHSCEHKAKVSFHQECTGMSPNHKYLLKSSQRITRH